MREYLLAFDLGTTGNKAVLVDSRSAEVVASATASYPTRYTADGGAEQSPADWWQSAIAACASLREAHPDKFGAVVGIGCGGMMNGLVAVDSAGRAVGDSMIHADIRGSLQAKHLEQQCGLDAIYSKTLNRFDCHLTLPKAMWAAQNIPNFLRNAASIVQANDYLATCLTGISGVTDPSNASLTGGFDPVAREWALDLWSAAGVETRLLPNVLPSTAVIGSVTDEAARLTGLRSGIPVVVGGGDGACASAGSGVATGEAYLYLGGTAWIGLVTDRPVMDRRLSSYCCLDERLTSFGTVQAAGSSIEWIGRIVGDASPDFAVLDTLAQTVPAGSRKLFYLPYLQGERAPLWDDAARGMFFGLATHHDKGAIYRSVLEGVSYALRSILDVFSENGRDLEGLRLLGGGASSGFWSGMLANVVNRRLAVVSDLSAATSLGAAMAAGVGVGCWRSIAEAAALVSVSRSIEPDPVVSAHYDALADYWATLYPVLKERFASLALLEDSQCES